MKMPKKKESGPDTGAHDLHGNAPDQSPVALLLVDVINDLDFPANEKLVRDSEKLAERIALLKQRCKQAGIPAIYINDNHGKWRSEFSAVAQHCLRAHAPGRAM
jgi:nicotinamidase-related amidase